MFAAIPAHRFAPIAFKCETAALILTPLISVSRSGKLQQFGQRGGAGMVHGRAHRRLHRFQIKTPGLAPTVEDDAQELIWFACDFQADRFRRFFPDPTTRP
jgi:hypothetical protein